MSRFNDTRISRTTCLAIVRQVVPAVDRSI